MMQGKFYFLRRIGCFFLFLNNNIRVIYTCFNYYLSIPVIINLQSKDCHEYIDQFSLTFKTTENYIICVLKYLKLTWYLLDKYN